MTFKTLEDVIFVILAENEDTRQDDMLLYSEYVYEVYTDREAHFAHFMYFDEYFVMAFEDSKFRITNKIAPYESVSRTRRFLQKKFDYLQPTKEAIELKKEREKEYREYYRKEKNK